jgi:acyl-coenzyme A synthetase/AMP-(fatty) acid ligase
MYGPTETTVWSATATVAKDARSVTIGRPIANTQIFLVDRRSKIVPIGASGELLIGGAGVARGYLGRTDLTAEKFVKLPMLSSGNNGGRLYRTGDLARYRDDGQIEFLGRIDHQVKVHGHRIELAEVETALCRHAAVRQSVVMARDASDGQAQLVAYVVPEHPDAPAEGRLGVERWQTVWDDAFQQECSIDPTFRLDVQLLGRHPTRGGDARVGHPHRRADRALPAAPDLGNRLRHRALAVPTRPQVR